MVRKFHVSLGTCVASLCRFRGGGGHTLLQLLQVNAGTLSRLFTELSFSPLSPVLMGVW